MLQVWKPYLRTAALKLDYRDVSRVSSPAARTYFKNLINSCQQKQRHVWNPLLPAFKNKYPNRSSSIQQVYTGQHRLGSQTPDLGSNTFTTSCVMAGNFLNLSISVLSRIKQEIIPPCQWEILTVPFPCTHILKIHKQKVLKEVLALPEGEGYLFCYYLWLSFLCLSPSFLKGQQMAKQCSYTY